MKNFLLALTAIASMGTITAEAQDIRTKKDANLFNHLDLNLTAGTTGVGFDLSTPIGDYVRLRSGLSVMPHFNLPTTFTIGVGDDKSKSKSKLANLSNRMSTLTGKEIDSKVDVTRQMIFWNWDVLVDIYPFKHNKHWRLTTGFYLGPSRVAEAYNDTGAMPTLMAVNIYNRAYEKLHGKTPIDLMEIKLIDLGEGFDDSFLYNIDNLLLLQEKFDRNGRMGVRMGTYKRDVLDEEGNVVHQKGETYMMEPGDDCMVRANMYVNSFKPYIGFGYGGRLSKTDDRYHVAVDCGLMMWGGTPRLETHDGTDLIRDVENVPGKIGSNVRMIEKLKVFPVLSFTLTRKLF